MSTQNVKNGIETVKELINGAITENGRYAVTGSSLNTILLSMMDVVDEFYDEYSGNPDGSGSSGSNGSTDSTGGSNSGGSNTIGKYEIGNGLTIIDNGDSKMLTATSEAVLVGDLNSSVLVDESIPKGESIQNVLEKLFTEIIPFKIPSVLEGDVIVASEDGKDFYTNHIDTSDRKNYIKTGLQQGESYIRLFVISQVEPIYINVSALYNGEGGSVGGKVYQGSVGRTINVTVNNSTNVIGAEIIEGAITPDMLTNDLKESITNAVTVTEKVGEPLEDAEVDTLFDEIFV